MSDIKKIKAPETKISLPYKPDTRSRKTDKIVVKVNLSHNQSATRNMDTKEEKPREGTTSHTNEHQTDCTLQSIRMSIWL